MLGLVLVVQIGRSQQCASFLIRQELEQAAISGSWRVNQEAINEPLLVGSFYHQRSYELFWTDRQNLAELMQALMQADMEGLRSEDYHVGWLKQQLANEGPGEMELAHRDLLLTDAFFSYAKHLVSGKIDPESLYPGKWKRDRRLPDFFALLEEGLAYHCIGEVLQRLKPPSPPYHLLVKSLAFFEGVQARGGWPAIPTGGPLEQGDSSDRVVLIKKRLIMSGYLSLPMFSYGEGAVFDMALDSAIRRFQTDHGLKPDGVVGRQTGEALNVSALWYVEKIKINLERMRWLPLELGSRHILVNIPEFNLYVKENDSLVLKMRAVVGRPERSTPVFSSHLRYLVLNPTWTVPPTILKEDVLPAVAKDIGYLEQNSLRLLNRRGEEIAPVGLPWSAYTERNFPYIIRQDPGLHNAMGLIKFQLSNQFQVFLHDTNARLLFGQANRALSSGCIRVEQPFALAVHLLKGSYWTPEKLAKEISSGKTRTIVLKERVPVHLIYFTAFVNEQGELQWRDDIYSLDAALLAGLQSPLR